MQIVVLGANHKRAPLALRERLAFPSYDMEASLQTMRRHVADGAILSTCHRVELYAATPDGEPLEQALFRFWSDCRNVPVDDFQGHVYRLTGRRAVKHLFTVACGLDSAIVGEPQILGQVREALRSGLTHGSIGRVMSALFRQAITTGKRARTETEIGRNAVSISYAAVELAKQAFGDLRSSRVLLIGAGKMGELAARNLVDKGAAGIAVVGRTTERARQLALRCGDCVALDQLQDALLECDIVITCTSAPHHVIDARMVARAMQERSGRPIFLIDIAVPRDIEPAAGDIAGVHLYNIDDLESTVAANVRLRRSEAVNVAPIIREEVDRFQTWLATQSVVPTITALREQAETIRRTELARTSAVLSRLPERDRRRIEALTLALQKKLLHHPIALLRAHAANGDGLVTAQVVRELFALDTAEEQADGDLREAFPEPPLG